MTFDDPDPDLHAKVRGSLLVAFAEDHDRVLVEAATQLLELKGNYLNPDPIEWNPQDVVDLLLDVYPAHVMMPVEECPAVIRALAAYLRFLGAEDFIPDDVASGAANGVEALAAPFVEAMADESRWGMSKRLISAMAPGGIADQEQLDTLTAQFNELPIAERDRILGPLGSGMFDDTPIDPLPPVRIASDAAIHAAAEASTQLIRVRRLVEFVGKGRPITDTGNLKLADGKALVAILGTDDPVDQVFGDQTFRTRSSAELTGVDYTFQLAQDAQFLETTATRVGPGSNADLLTDDPSEAWYGLLLMMLEPCGPVSHRLRGDRYGFAWFAESLDTYFSSLFLELYREQDGFPVTEVVNDAWDALLDEFDLADEPAEKLEFHRGLVVHAVRDALERFAELGAVSADDDTVALTPLGIWAVQRFAANFTDAPIVGQFAGLDAGALLHAAADLPDELALAGIDEWIASRDGDAADLLASAFAQADETGRGLAFRALLRIGPSAVRAVDQWDTQPELRPYARLWHADIFATDISAADPEEFVLFVHAALTVLGPPAVARWGPLAAGGIGTPTMLDQVWRVRRPETEDVLTALGEHLALKGEAKAARKALFRHRSPHRH